MATRAARCTDLVRTVDAKSSRASKVYDQLRWDIVHGVLRPNEPLFEGARIRIGMWEAIFTHDPSEVPDVPDEPLDRCIPVSESHDNLTLNLKPGFRTHFTAYPQFSGAGGPNPRVVWNIRSIIADNDWKLDP